MRRWVHIAGHCLEASAWGFCLGFTFCDLVGSVARVDGVSMQPTLNPASERPRDWIFVNTWNSRFYEYSRGEVVCLYSPREPKQRLIKRVIAFEGDVVRTLGYRKAFVKVPKGHCWVEGDHHAQSMDSNFFGPVPVALILGKASHIVWPPSRWGSLEPELPADRKPF